ncbi:hypothetical protein OHA98_20025 [Streptomyces sp. NBC_00654]|uniref:hypothetical protein n=1 Tax=Streptomyces sp. NBC_00654 TaxID=2975799 RepID=UPI0022587E9A|nr:hypothetical protein [Streptomyces sp. NBC_00654]MCX4967056.1 hypothetical protein [Streptomyces sp. NBC_00654]
MGQPGGRRLTDDEKTEVLRLLAAGHHTVEVLRRSGVHGWLYYDERRQDLAFEAAVMDAARRGGLTGTQGQGSPVVPIGTATNTGGNDREAKQAVLDVLGDGGPLVQAYERARITYRTLRRIRLEDPAFDAAVKAAMETATREREPSRCTVPECGRAHMSRGYCGSHYMRYLQARKRDQEATAEQIHAEVVGDGSPVVKHSRPVCSKDGCDQPHHARGHCKTHYAGQLSRKKGVRGG